MKLALFAASVAAVLAGCASYPAPSTAQASAQRAAITNPAAAAKPSSAVLTPAPTDWASGTGRMAD